MTDTGPLIDHQADLQRQVNALRAEHDAILIVQLATIVLVGVLMFRIIKQGAVTSV